MRFHDEPPGGENLPILPGHISPGRLERVLRSGLFAVTAELAPPDSADPNEVYARAKVFDGHVDAINATDGSGGNCHMSSVGVCALLSRLGYAMVMQMSCRDRNRIAMQADVLGASAMGVCNVLCLTGDSVQVGDHPEAKPVFDLDSPILLQTIRGMRDRGRFLSGRKIASPPRVLLGAAIDPFSPLERERPVRFEQKVAAGAEFVQTQYCFDVGLFEQYMQRVRNAGLHEQAFILAGVGPLGSARSAQWIRDNIPGVHIPDTIVERLKGARDQAREGVEICKEVIQRIRRIKGVHGVHIMAYRQERRVAEIVQETGILDGRTPWYPGRDYAAADSRLLVAEA